MTADLIAEVATAAGSALAGAMATAAWDLARDGVVKLFRRDAHQQETVAKQLALNADLVVQAHDPTPARALVAAAWQEEFDDLLRLHPEVMEELRELTARIQAVAEISPAVTQVNVASGHAHQQVAGRDLHINDGNFRLGRPDPS
jgi:FMN phosphatase YigB (HAD superfamily)